MNRLYMRCERCDKEMPYTTRNRKYCSAACRVATYREKKSDVPCVVCGESIRRSNEFYCSNQCYADDRKEFSPALSALNKARAVKDTSVLDGLKAVLNDYWEQD